MHCPSCKVELKKVSVAGIEIDLCGECNGVWFDYDELERVFNVYGAELGGTGLAPALGGEGSKSGPVSQVGRICPRCGAGLSRRSYDRELSVVVDGCEKGCGLWLDEGELTLIVQHMAKQRNLENPEQESEILLKIVKDESSGQKRQDSLIDQMVSADNESSGITRKLGLAVQALYKAMFKAGL